MVSEAKVRANIKYEAKTYQKVTIKLRIEEDKELIEAIEKAKEQGTPYRLWLNEIYEKAQRYEELNK